MWYVRGVSLCMTSGIPLHQLCTIVSKSHKSNLWRADTDRHTESQTDTQTYTHGCSCQLHMLQTTFETHRSHCYVSYTDQDTLSSAKYWLNPRRQGAQFRLSGWVLDLRPKGRGFEPHPRHCVVSLSKDINPSFVLAQPRKTRPFITERLLMWHKESNQQNCKVCLSQNGHNIV